MSICLIPLFLNISGGEMLVIFLVLMVVLGPSKIPEVARQIGRALNELKKATSDVSRELRKETGDLQQTIRREAYKIREEVEKVTDPKQQTRINLPEIDTEIPDVYTTNDPKTLDPEKSPP